MIVKFISRTGRTLTFSVYSEDGNTTRETGTSIPETPAGSGNYVGAATLLVPGDDVVIYEGADVVGGGEFSVELALETTIADDNPDGSSTDQTFTLAAGSTNNDEYKNMAISVTDVSGAVVSTKRVTDYVGGAIKKITVDEAFEFPLAIGDRVRIWADTYSQTAEAATVSDIVTGLLSADARSYKTPGTFGYEIQQGDSHLSK